MQLSILVLGLVLLLFVHDTQAQISSAPSCAAGCITSAAQAAGCTTISDTTCFCGTSFRSATERCISQGVCNSSDQSVVDSLLNILCNGAISTGGSSSGTGPTTSGSGATVTSSVSVTIHVSNTPRPPITTGTFTIISSLLPPIPSEPTTDTNSAASSPGSTPVSATTLFTTPSPTSIVPPSLTLPIPTTTNGQTTSVVFSTVGGGAPTSSSVSQPNSASRLGLSSGVALCMVLSILLVHHY